MARPQRITRELLLDAAMQLVDTEGLGALTMRRLGDRVGADPAMVYRAFANKDELLGALADRVFSQARERRPAGGPPLGVDGGDPLEHLRQAAHGIRAALLAHPALIGVAVRRPPRQEATFRGIDAGLSLLLSAGLTARDAAHGYQAVLFYVLGFAVLEAPFSAAPDRGAAQQRETQEALAALPADDYPHVAATVEHLYTPDLDGQFDHGLRLLLDGLRSRAAPVRPAPGPAAGTTGTEHER
jgi:AcrR family transcriptional regulator